MKILYAYLVILLPVFINGAEMNHKKRPRYDREHDATLSATTKKAKLKIDQIDLDELIEKVKSVCVKLRALSNDPMAPIVTDAKRAIIDDFVKDVLKEKAVDPVFWDLVCMALYANMPKDRSFLPNIYYPVFSSVIHLKVSLTRTTSLYDASADAFCIACEQNKGSLFLQMAIATIDSDKNKVAALLIKGLFRKQKDVIFALDFLLNQDIDLSMDDYDLLRIFAYTAKDKAFMEFIVQHCVDSEKIDISRVFDLAFEAANLKLIELLAPHCPHYNYANAFSIVCDSTFDGHYGEHKQKAEVFAYLLSTQPSHHLLNRNIDGNYPLGMSQNNLLKRIVMLLIKNYKDLFVQLLEANAFDSQREVEGLDFQNMDEIIKAMKDASKEDPRLTPTFAHVDGLFRMVDSYEKDEEDGEIQVVEMQVGEIQAGSILLCMRHGIPLEQSLIAQESIEYVSSLLDHVKDDGQPLLSVTDEISFDTLEEKYALCKALLKDRIQKGFHRCTLSIYDEPSMSMVDFDPFNTSFYGKQYKIGLNVFFSHDEMFELICEKIEAKSLDKFSYLLQILKKEGYSIHLMHKILLQALRHSKIWAVVILIQEFPKLMKLEQADFWKSFMENSTSFEKLTAAVF